jgi:hypothetical protein
VELAYKPCKREPIEPVESNRACGACKACKWGLNYGAGQSFGVPAQTPSRDSVRFLRKTATLEAGRLEGWMVLVIISK